jgi:hypothetical protein
MEKDQMHVYGDETVLSIKTLILLAQQLQVRDCETKADVEKHLTCLLRSCATSSGPINLNFLENVLL